MSNGSELFSVKLTEKEFDYLSSFVYNELGIKMPREKKIMLESRLLKRLRELKLPSFKEYIDFLNSEQGKSNEIVHMFDVVTTNKTDFFREPQHFEYLTNFVLPEIKGNGTVRQIKIWSSASSSGEEPYTLAMVLANWCEKNPGFDYSILGTDISTKVLNMAVNGTYKIDRIAPVSLEFKKKYLLRHKDPSQNLVKIIPELRSRCKFERLNLMDPYYDIEGMFDILFCRNVLIYFDRQTQEKVINKLCAKLKKGGYFFLGHSESVLQMDVPLKQIKPTIFVRV